jgi:hypothetical protein
MPRAPKRPNNPKIEHTAIEKETIEIKRPKPTPVHDVDTYTCGLCGQENLPKEAPFCWQCGKALSWPK